MSAPPDFVSAFDSSKFRRLPAPINAVTSFNGQTGDVVATLATLWTYGHTVPGDLVANYFPMPSGNLRFIGATTGLSGSGFYENAPPAPIGDSRVGSDYHRRYYPTHQRIGGFVVDEFVGFDPTWGGNFSELQDFVLVSTMTGFSQGAGLQNGPQLDLLIGQLGWHSVVGFFDGPQCYPIPGFNSGQREDLEVGLYNPINGVQRRTIMNGYGQIIFAPQPNSAGITASMVTQIDPQVWPSSPGNNGMAWMVRINDRDPPVGMIDMISTTDQTSVFNGWGWELWGTNGAGTFGRLISIDFLNGIRLYTGQTAPGAQAVTINNSPGAAAAPVEYLRILNDAGLIRYIPLLA